MRTAVLACSAVLLLSGCGLRADLPPERLSVAEPTPAASSAAPAPSPSPSPSATHEPAPPSPAPSAPGDPLALVGRWHVEAPGAAEGTAIVLGEELALFLPCGVVDGAWKGDGQQGLFVASVYGGDGTCFAGSGSPAPPWLLAARGFRVEDEQRLLLDVDGRAIARLRPGAEPTVGPNRSADSAAEPQVTPRLRERLADPAPLPAEAEPVTQEQLQRRWVPVDVTNPEVHLEFGPRDYGGSDGCNGEGGRYALGEQGRLVAIGGPSTAIGCDGAPVGYWVDSAGRAGLVDGELVLYDRKGELLGRLRAG